MFCSDAKFQRGQEPKHVAPKRKEQAEAQNLAKAVGSERR